MILLIFILSIIIILLIIAIICILYFNTSSDPKYKTNPNINNCDICQKIKEKKISRGSKRSKNVKCKCENTPRRRYKKNRCKKKRYIDPLRNYYYYIDDDIKPCKDKIIIDCNGKKYCEPCCDKVIIKCCDNNNESCDDCYSCYLKFLYNMKVTELEELYTENDIIDPHINIVNKCCDDPTVNSEGFINKKDSNINIWFYNDYCISMKLYYEFILPYPIKLDNDIIIKLYINREEPEIYKCQVENNKIDSNRYKIKVSVLNNKNNVLEYGNNVDSITGNLVLPF